jgi:hypothetical protein
MESESEGRYLKTQRIAYDLAEANFLKHKVQKIGSKALIRFTSHISNILKLEKSEPIESNRHYFVLQCSSSQSGQFHVHVTISFVLKHQKCVREDFLGKRGKAFATSLTNYVHQFTLMEQRTRSQTR